MRAIISWNDTGSFERKHKSTLLFFTTPIFKDISGGALNKLMTGEVALEKTTI